MTEKAKKERTPRNMSVEQLNTAAQRLTSTELVSLSVEINKLIARRKELAQKEVELLGGESK